MPRITKNIDTILVEAVEITSADERAAFVAKACGGDDSLQRHVEMMIANHFEAGDFLEVPADVVEVTHITTHDAIVGSMIGPYKLREVLGEGGMGIVYVAEQEKPFRRKVALKLIKPGMDSRDVISRFEAERQALALMDHPHIAKVLDAGTTADTGRPFFVMEFVRGIPITEYCDKCSLSTDDRLKLFIQVCQAVQHAHQKGIIHRDIKPSNVLVTLHDGVPVPKVIDFGVAKAINQRLTEHSIYTGHAQIVGTPLYMSPEQAELSGLDIDTRSDVYSLGVLLYELLTGATPFDRASFSKAGFDEMRRMIREDEPLRPSQRISTHEGAARSTISGKRGSDERKLVQTLAGELDWIVMKALEKDRSRRFESASSFAADVQRYLNDEPVESSPPSTIYRSQKFMKRHKGPIIAVTVMITLLVLGTVTTSIGMFRALRAEHTAELDRDRAIAAEKLANQRLIQVTMEKERATVAEKHAEEEAATAAAVREFIQNDLLAQAAPEKNARGKNVTVIELLDSAASRINQKFQQQPQIEAQIQFVIGQMYKELGEREAAQPHLERAVDLCRQLLGNEDPTTLLAINLLGGLYIDQGKYTDAEDILVKAFEISRDVFGQDHPMTANLVTNLGALFLDQGRFSEAEPYMVQAFEIRSKVLGKIDPATLKAMNNLAALYTSQGQLVKAEPLLLEALKSIRDVLGEEHPMAINCLYNLGCLYDLQRDVIKAEPLLATALVLSRRVLGEKHLKTLNSMTSLGLLYASHGDFSKGEPLIREALELSRQIWGNDHEETIDLMLKLARIYERNEEFSSAETLHREMLVKIHKLNEDASPRTAGALAALSLVLLKQQKYAEAEPLLRECLNIRELIAPDDWKTFNTKALIGSSLLGQQKFDEAEQYLLSGYEGMKQRARAIPPEGKIRMNEAISRLVDLYEAGQQSEKATLWRKTLTERTSAIIP